VSSNSKRCVAAALPRPAALGRAAAGRRARGAGTLLNSLATPPMPAPGTPGPDPPAKPAPHVWQQGAHPREAVPRPCGVVPVLPEGLAAARGEAHPLQCVAAGPGGLQAAAAAGVYVGMRAKASRADRETHRAMACGHAAARRPSAAQLRSGAPACSKSLLILTPPPAAPGLPSSRPAPRLPYFQPSRRSTCAATATSPPPSSPR
jgi:hypothetical protein